MQVDFYSLTKSCFPSLTLLKRDYINYKYFKISIKFIPDNEIIFRYEKINKSLLKRLVFEDILIHNLYKN